MYNISKTTNITINNCGYGMPMGGGPMMPMGGMWGPSLFSMSCMPANNSVAAGQCCGFAAGLLLSIPGALKTAGKVIAWPFKTAWNGAKWVFNNAIKPAATWVYNHALKPIGKWIGGLFSSKSDKT